MQSPFSAMLRAINRDVAKPLNILCAPTHEAYETNLAKTGHMFFALSHQSFKKWDTRFRPYPWNYQPLTGNDPHSQIRPDMAFDLVLSQNKFGQYQVLSQIASALSIPLISLEHTLPVPQWNASMRADMRRMCGDLDVFISSHSVGEWGFDATDPDVKVVHHGIDTEFFAGWTGGDGRILTVVNDYVNRDWCCGFSAYRQITKGLPVNPWGLTPGFSHPAQSPDHLRHLYSVASVFLNTSIISPVPTAMLEAMSVGCPVVTTNTCMIPEIIEDGVNGYASNDPAVLRARLEELLADPDRAKQMGEAARRTIEEKFGLSRFVADWNSLFERAVGTVPGRKR